MHNVELLSLVQALQAELALQQGRIAEAITWAQQFEIDALLAMQRSYLPELTLAKTLIFQDTVESHEQAAVLLARLQEHAQTIHNRRVLIEVLALTALLHESRDDELAAIDRLEEAVRLAEPGGWIRTFVDLGPKMARLLERLGERGVDPAYIAQILAAFPGPTTDGGRQTTEEGGAIVGRQSSVVDGPPSPLVEPLTYRELEVLELMAQRFTNKEIAAQLAMSVGTVKQHAYNINQKLNVRGRRQAVAKAISVGILPS
jgi:LuxR family maltose regulon positive regulatory protein